MEKLDDLIKDFNKKAKEEVVTYGLNDFNYDRIPFTSPRMNYCTFGGIPVGKITEFYGEEHGGKTTSALDIVANFQNMYPDRKVLYVDTENSLDPGWAKKIGVDLDSLILLQPKSQSAEEIFEFIVNAVDTGEVGLWVLDSIGAMVSSQELEKSLEEKTYAGISKSLTLFGKKIEMVMHRHNCTGIGINQVRENINSTWGGLVTPGGKAWKHFCSVRMEFRRGPFLDEKRNELTRSVENPVGNKVLMSMTKNKTCPPTRRTGYYTINYATGIDYLWDLLETCIKYGIVDQHGSWFDIVNTETGEIIKGKIQGQANLLAFLESEENLDILMKIEELVDHFQNE